MDTREEVELPPLEWREMLAYEPVRCIEETCALEHAGEYEIRAEREAQLKASLAANREQKAEIERLQAALACKEAEVELTLNRYRELASKSCSCGRAEALEIIPAVQGMYK